MDRKAAVAGSFYPADEAILRKELGSMFAHAVQGKAGNVRAIIVPHAGYVFSGTVAASAYRQIERNAFFENIFIIASSHHFSGSVVSTYPLGNYQTPMGDVAVNTQLAAQLIEETDYIRYEPNADAPEHSIEVQLPFIKHWLNPVCRIVPLIICTWNRDIIAKLSQLLEPYFGEKNLFVVSTDFSHYPSYGDAVAVDGETTDAILTNSSANLLDVLQRHKHSGVRRLDTDLCGWTSVLALLNITEGKKNLSYRQVDYANSGDSKHGDKFRVVGYSAIVVSEHFTEPPIAFSEKEQHTLLAIAREAIAKALHLKGKLPIDASDITDRLNTPCGAFVTIYQKGELMGCIGRFETSQPLHEVVKDVAHGAAFDSRFPSIAVDDVDRLDLEISVLTPLKRIASIDEIELGRHGIYIRKGLSVGTFLPQVAIEAGWTKEEFLGYCCTHKAHLAWDGWKNADIYTYETIIIRG